MRTTDLCLFLVIVAACQPARDSGSAPAKPTESRAIPALEVSAEPILQIGLAEGPEQQMFSGVVGVVRLQDGRIVVADGGSSQLRFFDADGQFLRTAGGEGQGPGEFEYLFDLRHCVSDYLYAFELPWEANRFTLDGEFVDTFTLGGSSSGGPYSFACSENAFLALSWGVPTTGLGFFRTYGQLDLLDGSGEPMADYGEFPVSERHGHTAGSGPHPYGKQTVLGLDRGHAYVGTADASELRRIDLASGDSVLIAIDDLAPELTLASEEVERFREWTLENATSREAAWWRDQFRTLEFPPTIPAYTQLVVDQGGALWVRDFKRAWDDVERWRVYTSEGEAIGAIDLPLRFRVHEIGVDYLAGVWTDEMGTEYVRAYELTVAYPRTGR